MSFFSNFVQTLHTILGKGTVTAGDATVVKTLMVNPNYQEWCKRKAEIMQPGKRCYIIKSLWHGECSRCDHYVYFPEEDIDRELSRLCVENYRTASRAFKDCFADSNGENKPWRERFPALFSEDNVQVIKTLQKKWKKINPTLDITNYDEDMKFLISIDSHFQNASKTHQYSPVLLDNYDRALKCFARLASAMKKPMIEELILIHVNERTFNLEHNEPYTLMCWGEPAYAFLGGPLTDRQLKWMAFAINVAHVPEKESDQIKYEHDDGEAEAETSPKEETEEKLPVEETYPEGADIAPC